MNSRVSSYRSPIYLSVLDSLISLSDSYNAIVGLSGDKLTHNETLWKMAFCKGFETCNLCGWHVLHSHFRARFWSYSTARPVWTDASSLVFLWQSHCCTSLLPEWKKENGNDTIVSDRYKEMPETVVCWASCRFSEALSSDWSCWDFWSITGFDWFVLFFPWAFQNVFGSAHEWKQNRRIFNSLFSRLTKNLRVKVFHENLVFHIHLRKFTGDTESCLFFIDESFFVILSLFVCDLMCAKRLCVTGSKTLDTSRSDLLHLHFGSLLQLYCRSQNCVWCLLLF